MAQGSSDTWDEMFSGDILITNRASTFLYLSIPTGSYFVIAFSSVPGKVPGLKVKYDPLPHTHSGADLEMLLSQFGPLLCHCQAVDNSADMLQLSGKYWVVSVRKMHSCFPIGSYKYRCSKYISANSRKWWFLLLHGQWVLFMGNLDVSVASGWLVLRWYLKLWTMLRVNIYVYHRVSTVYHVCMNSPSTAPVARQLQQQLSCAQMRINELETQATNQENSGQLGLMDIHGYSVWSKWLADVYIDRSIDWLFDLVWLVLADTVDR